MKTVKILIADHEEASLNHLGAVLLAARHQVKLTRNGKDAFTEAQTFRPDVCVIDPMVAGIDGFTLSQRLRKAFPKIGIIISTGIYKGDRYRRDAMTKYGASVYLEKPYSDAEFMQTVMQVAGIQAEGVPLEKHETLPGGSMGDLDLDLTMGVENEVIQDHLNQMREQLVLRSEEQPSLFDNFELDGMEQPALQPMDEARQAAALLEDDLKNPDTLIDEKVQANFAKLEQSAQEAANEREPAYKPADTFAGKVSDHGLTADEIFGGLISDIETGRKKPPGATRFTDPPVAENTNPDQAPFFPSIEGDTNPNQAPLPDELAHSPDCTSKYELLNLISEDQAFEVWKAKLKGEKGFERVMALKKIKAYLADNLELNSLFLKEAKLAAALSHPNIVQIYELGEYDGARFLAREFLDGESLQSILKQLRDKDATLPPAIAAFLGAKVADALAYAHAALSLDGKPLNIVHHHLSPDNVIITNEGELKVLNFGTGQVTARAAGTDMIHLDQLQSLSPEQASNQAFDHRADIFALGSLLYRALTGLDPFAGTGRESVILSIKNAKSAPIALIRPDIPQDLSDIVAKAMQGNLEARYASASELAADLRRFIKKSRQRISDSDVASFLRALRAGVVMEAPSSLPPEPRVAPIPEARQATTPQPTPPQSTTGQTAFVEPESEPPVVAPPIRRKAVQPPPPESNSDKVLIGVIVLLLILLAAVLAWKFMPSKAQATVPVSEPTVAQPLAPSEEPELVAPQEGDGLEEPDSGAAVDAAEATVNPAAGAPISSEPATTLMEPAVKPKLTDAELELKEEKLRKTKEEFDRKRELLEQLKKEGN